MSNNIKLLPVRLLACIVLMASLLFTAHSAHARGQALPDGFENYLVYMATGTIPFAPHPNPGITGCGGGLFCDGDYFHKTIMGRTDAQIDLEGQRAKDYFYARFGLNVDALVADGRLAFDSFMIDPRGEYRAYTKSGAKAPSEGWVVRDGGFIATVLDPNGIELGGEFQGAGLPPISPGGLILFGNYNILETKPNGKHGQAFSISYRSDMPMITNDWGELIVNCQISLDEFASGSHSGKAQGMGLVFAGPGGLTLSWRNVLTIGGL